MSEQEPWVVVWAVPKQPLDAPCWLMVKHIERGWELPGGTISETETLDMAALRELFEETGVLGTATNYEENIIHPNFNFFIITKLTKSRTNSNKN